MTLATRRSWKTQSRPPPGREGTFPTASYSLCRGADDLEEQSVLAGVRRAERWKKDPRPGWVQSPSP